MWAEGWLPGSRHPSVLRGFWLESRARPREFADAGFSKRRRYLYRDGSALPLRPSSRLGGGLAVGRENPIRGCCQKWPCCPKWATVSFTQQCEINETWPMLRNRYAVTGVPRECDCAPCVDRT